MRLGLTGQVPVPLTGVSIDLLLGEFAELDPISTVDLLHDGSDLVLDGDIEIVEELEVGLALACGNESFGELDGSGTTLSPVVTDHGGIGTSRQSFLTDELELGRGVGAAYLKRKVLSSEQG